MLMLQLLWMLTARRHKVFVVVVMVMMSAAGLWNLKEQMVSGGHMVVTWWSYGGHMTGFNKPNFVVTMFLCVSCVCVAN